MDLRPLTAVEFCERVVPALAEREAENGLVIWLAQRLAAQPDPAHDALLLSVETAGVVVAASVWTPPHDVVVTRAEDALVADLGIDGRHRRQ